MVCGSLNRQSRIQARKLIDEGMAADIRIDLERALSEQHESEIDRLVQLATAFYCEKRSLLIQTPAAAVSPDLKKNTARPDSVQAGISRILGIIVAKLLQNIQISGLILTGGSTAAEVVRQLKGTGIVLVKELSPLVPLGRLVGGPFDGLRVITKGGGVGDTDIFVQAVNYLRTHRQ